MMEKHVFFVIRFSVIQPGSAAWSASSSDLSEMAKKIFDTERLRFRLRTFRELCLRSLMDQKLSDADNIRFTVLLLVSDALPDEFKKAIFEERDRFNLHTKYGDMTVALIHSTLIPKCVDGHKNMNEAIKHTINQYASELRHDCTFSTVRLDDDDALYNNYVSAISNYLQPAMEGMCVSFPYGIEGFVDSEHLNVSDIRHCYFPKAAQGLAYINTIKNGMVVDKKTFHVLNTNNHTKVDERYPVIIDSRMPMYFRTLSLTNDSNGSPQHKFLPKVEGVDVLNGIPCISHRCIDPLSEEVEDFFSLEVSKKASHAAALIASLNERISQYRNKRS